MQTRVCFNGGEFSPEMAMRSDMEQYYSAEKQKRYGVVGIELFPPKRMTDESVVPLTLK